ncbi:MAG: two-component regulator propeller domain-containing protein, partial [Melioribacteraceae bacterium]
IKNVKNFRFKVNENNIRKIFKGKENFWIGTYNGLYKIDKENFETTYYFNDQSNLSTINSNKIRLIFQDSSSLIWIGTNYGVNKYNLNKKRFDFEPFTQNNNKHNSEFVIPINKTHKEILWGGNIDPNNFNNIGIKRKIKYYGNEYVKKEFKSNVSLSFYKDENNVLWSGSYRGIQYLDIKDGLFKYIQYKIDNLTGLDNNFVKNFYFDKKGDFWASSFGGGLTHYSKSSGKIKRYRHDEENFESLRDSRVMTVLEDSKGLLWVGTYGGLDIFDREKETFKHFSYIPNDTTSITNERINSIFESSTGELWIGTYQGLNKYNRGKDNFKQFTTKDGLEDNSIYGILEDDFGNLWIRTNKGISKFNPSKKEFVNYNISDGLQGMEANGNIYFKNKFGKMFFAGLKGFNSFHPKDIIDASFIPPVVFTELKVMDKKIKVGANSQLTKPINEIEVIEFSSKDKIIDIEFSSLHYAVPNKNKYKYKLKGFSDKWNSVSSNNRTISLMNLNSGEYELHVKASNSDGVWNNKGRSIKLIVNPPYWATWWFILASIFSILLLIFIIYEYRLKKLMEVEKTRTRIAKNLHDEVGGTLASIQYFVNAIKRGADLKSKDKFLNLIMDSSNEAQEKIKDIIWTVNPKEDGLSKFLVKFNRYASDLFDSKDIGYVIDFPKVELDKKICMEKRQHLWCVCKETVTNVVKHSNCKNVNISFQLFGNTLHYTIEDNGVGFDKSSNTLGSGLENIAFRADKLKAKYGFETSKNKGMKLEISFKIKGSEL